MITRWCFLRGLALVYLVALVSLWVQIDGLIGSQGILPIGDYLSYVEEVAGTSAYWKLPTLTWLDASDLTLHLLCAIGVLLSLLLLVGLAQIPALLGLWAVYLSLMHSGQVFLSFQWDILLVEVGFAALFVAPPSLGVRRPWNERAPFPAGIWLLRIVLFKLMLLSGAVKLLSMDETWWGLTALDYHYFTQPLPLWTSWYAQQLPAWIQKTSVALTYVIEIGLPFLIFLGRWPRLLAFLGLLALQLLIAASGNYGYFNLLTVVLCLPLLDDAQLRRSWPPALRAWTPQPTRQAAVAFPAGRLARTSWASAVALLIALNAAATIREMSRTLPADARDNALGRALDVAEKPLDNAVVGRVLQVSDAFELVNGYGLFRSMTRKRPEISIEASRDGVEWLEYGFRFKPGDPSHAPRWVAPHQPRLDWQMWFAALNPRRATPWLQGLTLRLLEGTPQVLALFESVPFDPPPRFVRLVYYEYAFTTPEDAARTGDWWTRRRVANLSEPISLEAFQER